MASGDLKFYNDFVSYTDAMLPGVRLPQINIEDKYYKKLGIPIGTVKSRIFIARKKLMVCLPDFAFSAN